MTSVISRLELDARSSGFEAESGLREVPSLDMTVTVDEVLSETGELGWSQKKFFFIVGIISVLSGMVILASTFTEFTPEWKCVDVNTKQVIALETDEKCNHFDEGSCSTEFGDVHETVVSEWSLVCRQSYLARLPQTAFFLGTTLSNFIVGPVGDKYGRKFLLVWSLRLIFVLLIICALSTNLHIYIGLKFLMGFCKQGISLSSTILLFELMGPKHRSAALIYSNIPFSFGGGLLTVLAYFLSSWRWLLLVTSAAYVLTFISLIYIPESPSWLMVNNKPEQAMQVLRGIADDNRVALQSIKLAGTERKMDNSKGFLSLFSFPKIAKQTVILLLCWFAACLSYYGVSFALGDNLGGNRYVNFLLGTLVEIPSVCITDYISKKHGSKYAFSRFLISSGICLMSSYIISDLLSLIDQSLAVYSKVGFAILGKFSVAAAYNMAYPYTSELYPTEVRNIGLSAVSIAGRLGGILSPFVLMADNLVLPICGMGVLVICGGICTLFLPETKDQPTPQTLEEIQIS